MRNGLTIAVDPEKLDEGSPEEIACFGAVGIQYGSQSLSECYDGLLNKVRPASMLSAYHLAEWLSWNWWRLRWEPRSNAPDWQLAHCFASIGEGYVWPNITVFSDGERIALMAKPTRERPHTRFRYLSDIAVVVGADAFEYVVGQFIEQVRGLLRASSIDDSNLDQIWEDIQEERGDPETAKRRKLEALLGYDPDQSDEATIENLVKDALEFGEPAMDEVAADHTPGGTVLSGAVLRSMAANTGFDAFPRDSVRLSPDARLPKVGEVAAWRLGAEAARSLREQERIRVERISNELLAKLAGVQLQALTDKKQGSAMSFALDEEDGRSRVVLRSNWETGRRFEVARLLGDRILSKTGGPLLPATRAYTYRQKVQRSFAAELLSPFETVDDILAGDYSMESQQEIAGRFNVSELTIRTLLVDHHRIQREELDDDGELAFATA